MRLILALGFTTLFFIVCSWLTGCAKIPFQKCTTPQAVRCDGEIAQRCEGGYWYPDMDCSEVGQKCIIRGEGNGEVVRCE